MNDYMVSVVHTETGESRAFDTCHGDSIRSHYISGNMITLESDMATYIFDIESNSRIDCIYK